MTDFNLGKWNREQILTEAGDPYITLSNLEVSFDELMKENINDEAFLEDFALILEKYSKNINREYLNKNI